MTGVDIARRRRSRIHARVGAVIRTRAFHVVMRVLALARRARESQRGVANALTRSSIAREADYSTAPAVFVDGNTRVIVQ